CTLHDDFSPTSENILRSSTNIGVGVQLGGVMRILRACGVFGFSVCALLLGGYSLRGQTTDATVTGQVTDQSGRTVPDVKVVFTSLNTNTPYTTVTLADGTYRLVALRPGIYRAN